VHREQLESNVTFFNPYHAEELATILDEFKGQQREENNYSTNVQDFGKKFIEIAYQINR
jgi:Cdc6-like AAA superfamily ATPase